MGKLILTIVLAAMTVAFVAAQQASPVPTPRDLFERARMLEENNQKLADAIGLYEQAAVQAAQGGQRELAATAYLRIGLLHERLGRKSDAERAFKIVVAQYADQTDTASQARERLPGAPAGALNTSRLWHGPDVEYLGSVSPDGRHLSVVDWNSGDLALRDFTTGTTRRLTSATALARPYAFYSRISPTGSAIVFQWNQPVGGDSLRLLRLNGPAREPEVLYANDQLSYMQPFDWSQDGSRILALFSTLDRTNQIAVISVADRSARVVKTLDWRYPRGMTFSPDGRWIAYDFPQKDGAAEHDIFLLAADGGREHRLVEHPDNDFVLGWTPDGRHLLFGSTRTGAAGIWRLPMQPGGAAGPPVLVRGNLGARLYPLGFSQSGAFYYASQTVVRDVFTAALDPAGRLASSPVSVTGRYRGENVLADWSRDGRSLALIRFDPGEARRRLVIRPADGSADGSDERELRPDLQSFNWPRWAPDGRSILVSGPDRRNRPGFYRVDSATGQTELLVRPEPGARQMRPEWTPDGQSLVFVRKTDDCACIIRRELASGQEVVLHRMPPSDLQVRAAVAPDGRFVAVLSGEAARPRLTLVPASGGPDRVLYESEDLAWLSFVDWSADSRHVLIGRGRDEIAVWRVPVAGGEPEPTGLAMKGLNELRISSDGRRVVFTGGENQGEVWVMKNFLPPVTSNRRRR